MIELIEFQFEFSVWSLSSATVSIRTTDDRPNLFAISTFVEQMEIAGDPQVAGVQRNIMRYQTARRGGIGNGWRPALGAHLRDVNVVRGSTTGRPTVRWSRTQGIRMASGDAALLPLTFWIRRIVVVARRSASRYHPSPDAEHMSRSKMPNHISTGSREQAMLKSLPALLVTLVAVISTCPARGEGRETLLAVGGIGDGPAVVLARLDPPLPVRPTPDGGALVPNSSDATSSAGEALSDDLTSSEGPRLDLVSKDFRVRIEGARPGEVIPVGSSAFAEVIVTYSGKGKSGPVDILFSSDGGELRSVTGKRLKTKRVGKNLVASLKGLKPNTEKVLLAELKILPGSAQQTDDVNRLRIALRAADDSVGDETILEWSTADCAGDYRRSLQQLSAARSEDLKLGVKRAVARAPKLPGRMLFKLPKNLSSVGRRYRLEEKTVSRRVCVKRRRYSTFTWSGGTKTKSRCVRYRTRKSVKQVRVPLPAEEGTPEALLAKLPKVAAVARKFAGSRGAASDLRRRRGRYNWVAREMVASLRSFIDQNHNPAICTGTETLMDYLVGRSTSFRESLAEVADAADVAPELAQFGIASLRKSLMRQDGGHPAFGGAPLTVFNVQNNQQSDRSIPELVSEVLALVGFAEDATELRDEADGYTALAKAQQVMKRPWPVLVSKASGLKARDAMALIEVAYYVDLADQRIGRLNDLIFGSIDDIRRLHRKDCVCDG